MINLYLNIKNLRIKNNLTQQELADIVHISRSYLSLLERNVPRAVVGVKLSIINEIAKALNVSINDVISD